MLNAKLIVVGGEVKATEIKLKLPCIIGRGKGSTVTLPHPLVSRQHCELFETNGRLWVRDLGSLNGTYVNNEKIGETELPPNELLTVGAVTFRAVYEPQGDTAANSDPPPQFLPSKARADDDQPTVGVDGAQIEEFAGFEEIEEIAVVDDAVEDLAEIVEVEEEGMPSTPLFQMPTARPQTAPTVPFTSRPAVPLANQPRPAIPTAVAPVATKPVGPAKPASAAPGKPTPKNAEPEVPAENAEDDDDLNDFLKSLGKK